MRQLSTLLGPRDPAQPLLTLLDGPVRVELSGTTARNWAAKTANFLIAQGSPQRVGVMLPLHWQAVTLLLGITDTGATAVVARDVDGLVGCELAFTTAERSSDALDVVEDVVAVSMAAFGGRAAGPQALATMVLDAGEELPGHGDHYDGPGGGGVEVDGDPVETVGPVELGPEDRVLLDGALADRLPSLLAALAAGASVLLCPGTPPTAEQLTAEAVTATGATDGGEVRKPRNP